MAHECTPYDIAAQDEIVAVQEDDSVAVHAKHRRTTKGADAAHWLGQNLAQGRRLQHRLDVVDHEYVIAGKQHSVEALACLGVIARPINNSRACAGGKSRCYGLQKRFSATPHRCCDGMCRHRTNVG